MSAKMLPADSSMRPSALQLGLRAGLLALALAAGAARPALALDADSADDVCAPAANPCNVTSEIDVVSGSTLDFGTRTVSVSGSGRFDFGAGSGTILCGNFSASTSGAAINARGPSGFPGFTQSGIVSIEARRSCSAGTRACLDDTDCQLGQCSVRRCSLRPTQLCTSEANCQLGICQPNRRCSSLASARCETNADCDFGSCPAQLTCEGENRSPVACNQNADCQFGTCSAGSGSIDLNGSVAGNSDAPGALLLRAADGIVVRKTVNLNGSSTDADGGTLELTAEAGSVEIQTKPTMSSGSASQGGTLVATAGLDVVVTADIDARGGEFDGGSVTFDAGRDVILAKEILANPASGEASGGEVIASAGRDIALQAVSATNRARIVTDGNSGGDGGSQTWSAERDMIVAVNARIENNAPSGEGVGGDIEIETGRDFVFAGVIEAKGKGNKSGGGFFELFLGGKAQTMAGSVLDVGGSAEGGGFLELTAVGDLAHSGLADATASNGGSAGNLSMRSLADATVGGTYSCGGLGGGGSGRIELDACRLRLTATANLDNRASAAENALVARESMNLASGSRVSATQGANYFFYRSPAKPPVVAGSVTPAAQLILDSDLVGCPVCGNGEIDQTETCDDGNLTGGDGCSAGCQNEKCIAQTPGYPAVPLCDDDNGCTVDTCNTALAGGTCEHQFLCDDEIACTVDTCVDEECVFVPDDSRCVDALPCTTGVCSAATGCTQVANSAPCDDGQFCTVGDVCSNFQCGGSPRNCSDSIACTVDSCNESTNACVSTPNHGACSDGAFCNGAEICSATLGCTGGTATDCGFLDDVCVVGYCDESGDTCATQSTNGGGACDDLNVCTENDRCSGGNCKGAPIPGCVACGNGTVDGGEQCDDGDARYLPGDYCRANCTRIPCAKPTDSSGPLPKASDALFILKVVVGQLLCDLRVCDADNSGKITAADALRALRVAVGQDVPLLCPP